MQHQATKRPIPHYWLAIMLLLAIRSLAGCSPPQPQAQQRESAISGSEPSPIATAKPILPSATPAPSSTPTPTATATPSPTATASPTPRPTLTPLPTIEPQQRGQVYSELMSTNGGCVLPCWWGFELGEASLDEVRQFYMAFGAYTSEQVTRDGIIIFYATFVDPLIEDGIQVSHSFVAREGVIIEAEIMVMSQPNYQIEPILQQLSQPSDVWMWTIPGPFEGFLPAHFLLYFPDQGVLFGYATSGAKVDEKVKVCFDEQGSAGLHLWDPDIWDPDGDKGIAERTSESSSAFAFEGQNSIEEVSNWDAGQFYAVLSDPAHSECLETPSELWSHP